MHQLNRAGATTLSLFLLALISTTGCANLRPTHTGYLAAYPAPGSGQKMTLLGNKAFDVTHAPPDTLADVDSFYIEDLAWRADHAKRENAEPSRREPLFKTLRAALVKQLSTVRPVVDQPGPKTARVRAAITEVVDANLLYNVVLSIIAVPVSNGGATIEAEVLSPTDPPRQLAAVSYTEVGAWYDVFGYFIPQAHAENACKGAAKQLRLALQAKTGDK